MLRRIAKFVRKRARDGAFVILDTIVPKDDRIIVFGSSGGRAFNGNPRAVFDHVFAERSGYRPYVYLRKEADRTTYREEVRRRVISGRTLRDRLILLRARTLVGAHGQGDFGVRAWSRRKIFVQTWHGRGTKSDGWAHPGFPKWKLGIIERHNRLVTAFVTASELDSGEKARSFHLNERKLHPLGYPRNDALLKRKRTDPGPLDELMGLPAFQRVILYAPTFREGEAAKFFPFDDFDPAVLDRFLEERSALLLMRRHINDTSPTPLCGSRIIDFSAAVCPDVNDVLPWVDVLITDYSSLFFDFLLFERPIFFIPYDLERYETERGFMYGDYDRWTPGHKPKSFADLLSHLERLASGEDDFEATRRVFNALFNAGQTSDSSRRVFDLIERLIRDNAHRSLFSRFLGGIFVLRSSKVAR